MTYYIHPKYAPSVDGIYLFERCMNFADDAECEISIYASSRYILYVNGTYVCEGPCRSHEKVRYFDRVRMNLSKGKNIISVKVLYTSTYFTTVYNATRPGLALEVSCHDSPILASDASWSCSYLAGYKLLCHAMRSLPPYENYDASIKPISLDVIEGDRVIFRSNGFFTGGGAAYPYILEERPIPMIYPQESTDFSLIRSGDGYAEFDAGSYITAKVSFILKKNSSIKIIYSECYEFKDGKHRRDDASGYLTGYFDIVKSADEELFFETYWFRSFRYIRVEGDANAISSLKMNRVHYPFDINGSFECSDSLLNKMWEISKNTILCCAHEIISDCPYYEQQQYEFDSALQIAATYALTNDVRLTKKCIADFAVSQQPCGLLLSIYPASWAQQIIPSYSLAWIMMLSQYYKQTKDISFVSLYTGIVDGILGFFDRMIKEKGYITNTRFWDFFDWVPEWKDGKVPIKANEAHTLYHLYYAVALEEAAFLARELDRDALGDEYSERKKTVINIVRRMCYKSDHKMYSDGSDGISFSAHTSIWAILADAYEGEEYKYLIQSLYRTDISAPCFSMNYFLFRALEKCKRYDLASDFLSGWKTMIENGCTSWCENPDSPRSECHGWSSAPLYEFATNILGVKICEKDEILISPNLSSLTYAKGCVPTRFGEVKVNWEKRDGGLYIRVQSPVGVNKHLIHPYGKEFVFSDCDVELFEKED